MRSRSRVSCSQVSTAAVHTRGPGCHCAPLGRGRNRLSALGLVESLTSIPSGVAATRNVTSTPAISVPGRSPDDHSTGSSAASAGFSGPLRVARRDGLRGGAAMPAVGASASSHPTQRPVLVSTKSALIAGLPLPRRVGTPLTAGCLFGCRSRLEKGSPARFPVRGSRTGRTGVMAPRGESWHRGTPLRFVSWQRVTTCPSPAVGGGRWWSVADMAAAIHLSGHVHPLPVLPE